MLRQGRVPFHRQWRSVSNHSSLWLLLSELTSETHLSERDLRTLPLLISSTTVFEHCSTRARKTSCTLPFISTPFPLRAHAERPLLCVDSAATGLVTKNGPQTSNGPDPNSSAENLSALGTLLTNSRKQGTEHSKQASSGRMETWRLRLSTIQVIS